ncbi:MAG: hypothetical protein RLZZ385_2262 [Pseudomonadota bacterium]|jgi:cytochrome c-type biogenesis protein CcmH
MVPKRLIAMLLPPLLGMVLAIASLHATPVQAQVDTFSFDTPEQQERFRRLSNELRCPMCQNTNLTGSTGGVAEDLRREVHRMIMAGMSDREIEQFMFERYGDFIFYRPRLRADTLLLWFGPLIFLLIGGSVLFSIVRRSKAAGNVTLDADEQKRLDELLKQKP